MCTLYGTTFDPCLSLDFFGSVFLEHSWFTQLTGPLDFTDEDGCSSDTPLPWIESLGPDKPGFGPNFQSSDILAGTVGGALLPLFTVVAFLAWYVLFFLPMRQPL